MSEKYFMHKGFLIAGTLSAGLAVTLGAFGAHGLQNVTDDAKIIHAFQTGVEYQMYHALALFIVAFIFERKPLGAVKWAGKLFITGIILFSGSLYAITAIKINELTSLEKIGILTPIGGVFFIAGWLMLLAGILKRQS